MGESAAKSSEYDVIVVGSGPAGISAAVNVANRKRTVAVMAGQAPSGLIRKAHSIANYLGFTSASGEELAAAFMRHLEEFDVPLVGEKISKIIPAEDGFVVFSEREVYHAGAVVLATGVYREAEIEGEEDLVGQGVSYCVTCDGRLFAGRRAAFISYTPQGEEEASALAEDYGVDVTYVPLYAGDYRLPEAVRVLPGGRPSRLAQVDGQHAGVAARRGSSGRCRVHLQEQRLSAYLARRLGLRRPSRDRRQAHGDRRARGLRGGGLHGSAVSDSQGRGRGSGGGASSRALPAGANRDRVSRHGVRAGGDRRR